MIVQDTTNLDGPPSSPAVDRTDDIADTLRKMGADLLRDYRDQVRQIRAYLTCSCNLTRYISSFRLNSGPQAAISSRWRTPVSGLTREACSCSWRSIHKGKPPRSNRSRQAHPGHNLARFLARNAISPHLSTRRTTLPSMTKSILMQTCHHCIKQVQVQRRLPSQSRNRRNRVLKASR